METACGRLWKGGVTSGQVGTGVEGRETQPERRGKGATAGDFHEEGFLLKRLGMQGQGNVCSIRVVFYSIKVCIITGVCSFSLQRITITRSGEIYENLCL